MIKLEDALKLIKDNESSNCYGCYLPSLNKEVLFRPLKVAELKTVAKISLDEGDTYTALNALIPLLALEDIDLNKITEIDKIKALLTIKVVNHLGEDNYAIKCGKCEAKFNYTLPILDIIEKFDKAPEPKEIIYKDHDIEYKMIIDVPSLDLSAKHNRFINSVNNSINTGEYTDEQIKMINLHLVKYSGMIFIKRIFINGEELENLNELDLEQRNNFLDTLPIKIIEMINKALINDPLYDIQSNLIVPLICPKCNDKNEVLIRISDFFLI